ncbi:MAG: hypothetical protein ACJ8DI_02065 [Ktedonobacteraceae bacterium]
MRAERKTIVLDSYAISLILKSMEAVRKNRSAMRERVEQEVRSWEKHSIPMLQSRSNCLEKHHKCDTIGRRWSGMAGEEDTSVKVLPSDGRVRWQRTRAWHPLVHLRPQMNEDECRLCLPLPRSTLKDGQERLLK